VAAGSSGVERAPLVKDYMVPVPMPVPATPPTNQRRPRSLNTDEVEVLVVIESVQYKIVERQTSTVANKKRRLYRFIDIFY